MTRTTTTESDNHYTQSNAEGVAAWRRIADEIELEIADGRLAPGMQLPTEAQLAVRFSVHRHTVRRGLAALAARGLLRATQGRGTFVENRPLSYPIGSRTRFSEVISHEQYAPSGEIIWIREIPAPNAIAEALALTPGAPVVALNARRLADSTPIACSISYLPLPRFNGFAAAYRAYGAITPALAACGVKDYHRTETRISARSATAEEASLLNLAPGRVVMVAAGTNIDARGTPVHHVQTMFSADRVELVVEGSNSR